MSLNSLKLNISPKEKKVTQYLILLVVILFKVRLWYFLHKINRVM